MRRAEVDGMNSFVTIKGRYKWVIEISHHSKLIMIK
jgi:hypothetical protein